VPDLSTLERECGGSGEDTGPEMRPDGQMFQAGSTLSIGELAMLPWSPPLVLPLLEPKNINSPDPHRRCPVSCGGLLSTTSSLESLLTPSAPAFNGGRDLPDLEDVEEDATRAHNGDTGDPRSAKTIALASGLSRWKCNAAGLGWDYGGV
jgi:hypothetical protein